MSVQLDGHQAHDVQRPANKSQVEISGFGGSEKGNTKSSR